MRALFAIGLAAACLALPGCGPSNSAPQGGVDSAPSQATGVDAGRSERQRQLEFLNRIRQADPQFQTIQKAVLNENNELALILNRNVQMDAIAPLMRPMLTQMATEFPGKI
jgi:hypothetical protein